MKKPLLLLFLVLALFVAVSVGVLADAADYEYEYPLPLYYSGYLLKMALFFAALLVVATVSMLTIRHICQKRKGKK